MGDASAIQMTVIDDKELSLVGKTNLCFHSIEVIVYASPKPIPGLVHRRILNKKSALTF